MPPDALAELTRLQEQEERAVEAIEEHRRRLATLQALLESARRRGEDAGGIEARARTAEGEVVRAEQAIAAIRERVIAVERALPADPREDKA